MDGTWELVDGDSGQFEGAIWQEKDECLQNAMALPRGLVPAAVEFSPLPSKSPLKTPSRCDLQGSTAHPPKYPLYLSLYVTPGLRIRSARFPSPDPS